MGFRFQSYLHKNRHGTLCFRWRPPRDVADRFTQSAFVYSLGTKECKRARVRALYSLTRVNQFVALLRTMKSDKSKLFDTEMVRSIVLPDGTEHRVDYDPSNPAELAEANRILDALVNDERVSDAEFDTLDRALKPSPPARGRVSTPAISAAFQTFCAQKRSEGAWKDPQHAERYDYGPIVTELIQASGDRPIGSLVVEHLRTFKAKILADGSSLATKAKKLGRIKSFLNWARDEQQLTGLSTAILQLSSRQNEGAHYERFSDDDLKKLFHSPPYRDHHSQRHPSFGYRFSVSIPARGSMNCRGSTWTTLANMTACRC